MRTLEEWQRKAAQGTSGDMVWDILNDWEEDRLRWQRTARKPQRGQGMCADDMPPPRKDFPEGF